MRLMLEMTDRDFERLWMKASTFGFLRGDPRKRWELREKKEAVRYVFARLADLEPVGDGHDKG